MDKYVCTICGYIYDPANGDPDSGVEPGTSFADLPDDWTCPSAERPKTSLKRRTKPQGLSSTNISVTFRSASMVCFCYRISFSRPCLFSPCLRSVGSTLRPVSLTGWKRSQKPRHRTHGPETRGYLLPQREVAKGLQLCLHS